ncbi:prostacyclin synthase [Platysternon megacephalum]|uniref:Guanine nucleotide-binding protein subunit gamma n=1 Tax=Platysternon megacephalum TaxID=55544 RepID=A0A4D9ECQ2_9SAUR|nr:prostacyclin synthase [Platysternon megacephalum]
MWKMPAAPERAGFAALANSLLQPQQHRRVLILRQLSWPPGSVSERPLASRRSGENRMKEIMSNNNTTNISQARKAVEQLKMEAYMDRIKVSKAAADLLAYCDAHIGEDPLIIPVPASENPFREKKFFCTIL